MEENKNAVRPRGNQRVVNDLQRLLGKVRKEEKSIENRTYTSRTEVVRMILQEGED